MDALTDVLDSLRLKSSLYCRAHLSAPWGLNFMLSQDAVFHVIERGSCWLHLDEEQVPIPLAGGDFLVLPHGTAHQITDAPTTLPTIPIAVGTTTPLEYQTLNYATSGAFTSLLCGTFHLEHEYTHPFISLLPSLLHIRGDHDTVEWLETTLRFLASEAGSSQPGTEIILKRLADILLIKAIRFWVQCQESEDRGWLSALRDSQISIALSLMHRYPEQTWSVQRLAQEVAMSRSAFSARFSLLVGMPPLQYLTLWRMHKAASYLTRNEYDLKRVARMVGYDSEFALSKAFKRHFGMAPSDYRRTQITSEKV